MQRTSATSTGEPVTRPLRGLTLGIALILSTPGPATADVDLSALGGRGFTITGVGAGDESGVDVAGAGDVNGDGLADIIVGAPKATTSNPGAGVSYVVFGKRDSEPVDLADLGQGGFAIAGERTDGALGTSVSGAGDVNGDGLDDLIVGAYREDAGLVPDAGVSYVIFGKADSARIRMTRLGNGGFAIRGAAPGDAAGTSVSGAGDVNGDGLADVVIGAPAADPAGDDSGAAYVIFGKRDNLTVSLATLGDLGFAIEGAAAGERFGLSVSGAGDVDGDGLADVIVGAPETNVDSSSAVAEGAAYVIFGKADTDLIDVGNLSGRGVLIAGNDAEGANVGTAVAGAGDVNGDGLADVIVGRPAGGEAGAAYVVFGRTGGAPVDLGDLTGAGFSLATGQLQDEFGSALAGAGDLDGDGAADLVLGAPAADTPQSAQAGAAYLVLGKPDDAFVDVTSLGAGGFKLNGEASVDLAGYRVSGAGDVNGDGLSDLVLGAPAASPSARPLSGRSYVVFSDESPTQEATYRGYARNGDAGRVPVGATGDGSNGGTPSGRVWIDFDDGGELGADASLHEVTLIQGPGPFADAAAGVHWRVQTGRNDWSTVELTFRYTDNELYVTQEPALQVVHATAPGGPYRPLETRVDPAANAVATRVDELGYFFLTLDQGLIFRNGFD